MLHDDQMLLNETKEELQQQLNNSYSKNIRKYGTIIWTNKTESMLMKMEEILRWKFA